MRGQKAEDHAHGAQNNFQKEKDKSLIGVKFDVGIILLNKQAEEEKNPHIVQYTDNLCRSIVFTHEKSLLLSFTVLFSLS